MKFLHRAALAFAALVVSGVAAAAWPDRPITLIVPWGAGGGTDATARIIGALLEKDLGQPVTVVNRIGGRAVGAVQRCRAGPAGPGGRRRRDRAVLAAGGALAHRRGQGEEPGHHG